MFTHFSPSLFTFLQELEKHNDREWFNDNKQRYEDLVRGPVLEFISEMQNWIPMISPHYEASPKKVGGSLMRVYRDVRFSKDKSPYKTNVGIQFRHEIGKDVHSPGFYFHISTHEIFLAVGTWHPQPDALRAIREHIQRKPAVYQDAIEHKPFTEYYHLAGDTLTRPPKGYDTESPMIEEIKRKDFIAMCPLTKEQLLTGNVCELAATRYGRAQPLQKFLCDALGLRF
ncbi:DUF2461 domain-containing protein [Paraglaciecola sp. L1A13]|uniref:DUF2461 domain-containing protein n=1 Tax=Paraglaciecola sp. L1A13 TaxID=2686359 RepID=UPI00131D6E1D|nr:TIGR02453 family protein [Paraglaciecola sp. L1A13]|tara:strand:+ start:232 stop:915 length:684 start_codon:yes stop_codon:yes gene_type:complete